MKPGPRVEHFILGLIQKNYNSVKIVSEKKVPMCESYKVYRKGSSLLIQKKQ
jgi:hypothetical protein